MWPKRWLCPKDFGKRFLLEFLQILILNSHTQKNNGIFEISTSESFHILNLGHIGREAKEFGPKPEMTLQVCGEYKVIKILFNRFDIFSKHGNFIVIKFKCYSEKKYSRAQVKWG